ncbi:MAG TPA: trypsin-like peptidase domain-containing protein [Mycobacteriales bacterium]|jgi:putative serine protease PepD|nr:trypsin-like peptidase domain-containing protein [Mycobacteriales bacterium]
MDDRTERADGGGVDAGRAAPPDETAWWSRPAQGPYGTPAADDQPSHDQALYGQPSSGRPWYRPAGSDPSPYDEPVPDQPASGRPGPTQPPYGQPGYGESDGFGPPAGAPAYSAAGVAQPTWGADPYAGPTSPSPSPGPVPYGQVPFGQGSPAGAGDVRDAYGSSANGLSPYGQPGYGQNGYGQNGYAPSGYTQPAPWGAPVDTWGRTSTGRGSRTAWTVAAAVLAAALVGGVSGGVVASSRDGNGLTDPDAELGSGASSTTTIERAPDSVAGIANRVLRSTVSISVRTGSTGGSGSGVVLRSDGYVLTNNHVVSAGANGGVITVTVNGSTGKELPASIVGLDPETDLAVLKIETGAPFVPATLGRSADLVVGDPVVAIGSPLGLNGTVTTGIVSALNRTVNVPGEDGGRATPLLNAIQTDAAINPGNSGGALVDVKGSVVGINSAIATLGGSGGADQGGSIGVGFAIPVDEARSVAEEIIRTGKATHPAVGVEAENLVADDGSKEGARITRVVAGGPAADAGLQVGDVIDKVSDTEVGSVDELILALRQNKVGDRVLLSYVRGGSPRTTEVVLEDKAAN